MIISDVSALAFDLYLISDVAVVAVVVGAVSGLLSDVSVSQGVRWVFSVAIRLRGNCMGWHERVNA